MPKLGRLLLREACAAAVRWPAELQLRVNISPIQIGNGDFVDVVEAVLAETGLAAKYNIPTSTRPSCTKLAAWGKAGA